ncbi:aspartate/glutamate racemase family protein [Lacisediminimonas sp.]|uniref:aspartate/glutamate racemase family protein n=1 Tax=Lacisediminimonas sp. TaxID=3060582 RepID=UPI0027186469|nr:aspartate/glutamate racemase family protein [Lacisediminimonas sp.]MDO8299423.1 aspartate/glutamate racemase family protein [Lacisediminimonas sp.]
MRIRVIRPGSKQNTDPGFMEHSARVTAQYAPAGMEIETVFLDAGAHGGPMTGHINEARILSAAKHVVHEVVRAEKEGWDAVYLSGEYDVGAEIARHMVKIPVVDSGTVAAHFAPLLGDRICVLVVEDSLKAYTRKLLRRWGVADSITAMRTWNIPLGELWQRRSEVKELSIRICKDAIERDDVNVILPMCTVYTPFILPPEELEDAIGIPVVNSVAVSLRTAAMFVDLNIRKNQKMYPDTPYEVWGE